MPQSAYKSNGFNIFLPRAVIAHKYFSYVRDATGLIFDISDKIYPLPLIPYLRQQLIRLAIFKKNEAVLPELFQIPNG